MDPGGSSGESRQESNTKEPLKLKFFILLSEIIPFGRELHHPSILDRSKAHVYHMLFPDGLLVCFSNFALFPGASVSVTNYVVLVQHRFLLLFFCVDMISSMNILFPSKVAKQSARNFAVMVNLQNLIPSTSTCHTAPTGEKND